jgi:multiple sugar transport system permease protein
MKQPEIEIKNILLKKVGITGPAWLATPTSALLSVIIVDVWQWTPYIFMVLLAGLTALPREPFEAAKVGGASSWQTFRHITIPLLRPLILIVVLIRVMDAIRIFDIVFILTGGGPALSTELLSLYIYRIGFRFFRMGYACALSILLLIVTIILVNGLIKIVGTKAK